MQHIKRQQGQCVIRGKYISNSSFDLKVEEEHCELAVGCVVNTIALHGMAIAVYLVCLINEHVLSEKESAFTFANSFSTSL